MCNLLSKHVDKVGCAIESRQLYKDKVKLDLIPFN